MRDSRANGGETELSFDPRTWQIDDAETADMTPPITQSGHLSRFAFAMIGSILILIGGGVAAWVSRSAPPPAYNAPAR